MAEQVRCDLALEAKELYSETAEKADEVGGISVDEYSIENIIKVTRVKILNEEGEENLGKPKGDYITIEMPSRFYGEQKIYEKMCQVCAEELKSLTDKFITKDDDVILVVGLGNQNITADALGPKVISSLMITRHLKEYVPDEIQNGVRSICGIVPGVLGLTGIETGEIIKGLVDRIKPKLVIAIDALCSRKMERVNTTIQISDTGITPGEGVGNKRKGLNIDTLGTPVIAIGVPTVVDAATIAGDTLDMLVNAASQGKAGVLKDLPTRQTLKLIGEMADEKYELIKEVIKPKFGSFIVAPKDVDTIIDDISSVVANGINIAVNDGITLKDVDRYR